MTTTSLPTTQQLDWGSNALLVQDIVASGKVYANGVELSSTELGFVDGVTAGTVAASKAVVVDANLDAAAMRNLTVTNLDAGASATAGTVDIFPTTASKGKIQIAAADSSGNTTTTITNASQAAARTYTIPDGGATTANFVLSEGAATINGLKTFADSIKVKMAINNVNDTTPTAAELTTSFGAPATVGSGFVGVVKDNDTDTNGYFVFSNGVSFYFLKFTKAT